MGEEFTDESLPKPLIDALRRIEGHRDVLVPPEADAAILASAQFAIARRRWRRRAYRIVATSGAAAAVLMIGAWWGGLLHRQTTPSPQSIALRNDLDGDGRVDILDAFYLAKRIDGPNPQKSWDVNGDDKIDRADVDAIAAVAVRVGGGAS